MPTFCAVARRVLTSAATAIGDADQIRDVAHAIKGCCMSFGVDAMSDLSLELEQTVTSRDLTHAAELVSRLEDSFEVVERTLRAELARLAP